jgi:hypothetical protein
MRRPQDGQTRRRLFSSSALFCSPAIAISQPTASVAIARVARCGANAMPLLFRVLRRSNLFPRVGVRQEVQLAAAAIGDVRVELGRGQVGVPEHLLHGAEVGAPLEEVRRE